MKDTLLQPKKVSVLLPVSPRQNLIDPFQREMEPSVSAHLLSSETQDKLPVAVGTERQTDIHEVNVAASTVGRSLYGMPNSKHIGMNHRMRLPSRGDEPQISITA